MADEQTVMGGNPSYDDDAPTSAPVAAHVIGTVRGFLNAPFVGTVDIVHLFLITGLVIVFAGMWLMILGHIRAAAQTVV